MHRSPWKRVSFPLASPLPVAKRCFPIGDLSTSRRKSSHGNCEKSGGEEVARQEGPGEEGCRQEGPGEEGCTGEEGRCQEGCSGEEGRTGEESRCQEGPRQEAHPQ